MFKQLQTGENFSPQIGAKHADGRYSTTLTSPPRIVRLKPKNEKDAAAGTGTLRSLFSFDGGARGVNRGRSGSPKRSGYESHGNMTPERGANTLVPSSSDDEAVASVARHKQGAPVSLSIILFILLYFPAN